MRVFLLEDIEREVPVVTRIERYKAGEFYEIDDEFAMELIAQKKALTHQLLISQLTKETPTEEPIEIQEEAEAKE